MTDHHRIERRLQEAAAEVRVSTGLSSGLRRRIRRRRAAIVTSGSLAALMLIAGSTIAYTSIFKDDRELSPARPRVETLLTYERVDGFSGSTQYLEVATDGSAEVSSDGRRSKGTVRFELTRSERTMLQGEIDRIVWSSLQRSYEPEAGVTVLDGVTHIVTHDGITVEIKDVPPPPLLRSLLGVIEDILRRAPSSDRVVGCGPPVDFEPTYLPPGWIADLQKGSGGGAAWKVVGHYGNDARRGTTDKAEQGFAELFAAESPYPLHDGEEIRVLGRAGRYGAVHEGFAVEFTYGGCDYALIGYVEGDEFRRFAEGLRLKRRGEEPVPDEDFRAIWPDDSFSDARETCGEALGDPESPMRGPMQAALRFSTQVLGWTPAKLIDRDGGPDAHTIEVQRSRPNDPYTPDGRAVMVVVEEVMPECWFVTGVQRMPDEEARYQEYDGASLSVQDREVSMYFADFEDAVAATLEVGYGGESTQHVWSKGDKFAEFRLEFEPNDTGHFLVLLRDENGKVFSAFGSSLPAGSFAAG